MSWFGWAKSRKSEEAARSSRLEELQAELARQPDNLASRRELADLLREQGKRPDAVREYRVLIHALMDQGLTLRALSVCHQLLEVSPQDAEALDLVELLTPDVEVDVHAATEPSLPRLRTLEVQPAEVLAAVSMPPLPVDHDDDHEPHASVTDPELTESALLPSSPVVDLSMTDLLVPEVSEVVVPPPLPPLTEAAMPTRMLSGFRHRLLRDAFGRGSLLFRGLPASVALTVLEAMELRDLAPGTELFTADDAGLGTFVIDTGAIEVVGSRARGGVPARRLGPGDVVGDLSALPGNVATGDVTVAEPTTALFLANAELRAWADVEPELAARLTVLSMARRAFAWRLRPDAWWTLDV